MDSACIRYTELPSSALYQDYLYRFEKLAAFYAYPPLGEESYRQAYLSLDYPLSRRLQVAEALEEQNPGSASLARLKQPDTAVVVSGQQAGLFGGPAYTVYKALTAIRTAQFLTNSGIPTVPAFWIATEDHDFEEVRKTWVFDRQGDPRQLSVAPAVPAGRPAGLVSPRDYPVEELEGALHGMPFAADALALVRDAYSGGTPFGEAFIRLMRALFGPYGLIFIDPLNPRLRQVGAPLLGQAFERHDELKQRLIHRGEALEKAGYHAQVLVEPKTSLFFLLKQGIRHPLRAHEGAWKANGQSFSAAQLTEDPSALSPNALIRPVWQDYLLPSIGFVTGPAEVAYLAQSQVVYDALLGRMPVVIPRQGFTLLDPRSRKLIDRYGLRLQDFVPGEQHLHEKIAARLVPESLHRQLDHTKGEIGRSLDALRRQLLEFDPTLVKALGTSERKIRYQVDRLAAKAGREAIRREQRLEAETRELFARIYPHRQYQERFYGILPFVAEFGPKLIEDLAGQVNPFCPDHQVVTV